MKPAKVLIYFVVLVLLGLYVYLVEIRHKEKVQQAEKHAKKMVHLDQDKILKIALIQGDQPKVSVEKPAGTWVVSIPVKTKADSAAVESLLHAFVDAEPEKVVREKDVPWDEYGLDKPEFTVVASTAEKTVKLAFGASNPAKTSYYLRVDDEPKVFLVADTLKNSLNKSTFDLREKSVFGIAETDVSRIAVATKGNEVEFARKDPQKWVMVKPESYTVKQALMSTNVRTLTNLKAKEIIDDPSKEGDPYGLDNPEQTIILSGPKLEQILVLGKSPETKAAVSKEPDRYARLQGEETVYLIDGRSLKGLKTEGAELRDRSVLSFNPADIERFQIDLDGKTWAAAQDKEKRWTIEKPEKKAHVDAWTVTGLLWDLKDLEWKSLIRPLPENLEALHLDKPGLVVSLFRRDDKQPITLKVGWKAAPTQSQEAPQDKKLPEANLPAATTPPEGAKQAQEKPDPQTKPMESSQEIPAAPATLNALADPTEEQGTAFVLDGGFLTRVRGDLQRWTTDK